MAMGPREKVVCLPWIGLISTVKRRKDNMLAILALILIVLWLLGFFAFHVSTGLIHLALVVGIILILVHFLRGRT